MRFNAEEVFPGQAASIRSADIDFEKMVKSFMANQSRSEGIVNSPACNAKVAVSEATSTTFEATNAMPDEAMAASEVGNVGVMVCGPQEAQITVGAGFSLSDSQWDYLAWNKDIAPPHATPRNLGTPILQGFCSGVAVPVNEHVVLYDSDGLEALCSRQGKRCCNGGHCRPGSCPTLAYRLAYTELSCHVLAQELKVKQHKMYNRKFE